MPSAVRSYVLLALTAAIAISACAGTLPSAEAGDGNDASLARRVLDILEHRHVTHRPLDFATRTRLLQARPEAGAAELDALAKRYDPHSSYVTPAQLGALHAEIQSELPEARSARGRIVEHDDTRIGLIVVPGIYLQHDGHSTSHDVRFIAGELIAQGAAVLLLDLRGNGGGVIEDAVRLAGVFAGAGPVAFEHASDGSERRLASNEAQLAWHGRVVVWVDAGTAGASELFAGAMQDRGRALVIGERTYGEGTGQTLVLLSSPLGASAGAVRVTDRVFFRLDGKALQLKGVTPDIELAPAGAPRATERDLANAIRADDIAVPTARELARIDRALLRRLVERPQQAAGDDAALAIASAYARATPK